METNASGDTFNGIYAGSRLISQRVAACLNMYIGRPIIILVKVGLDKNDEDEEKGAEESKKK